MSKNKIKLDSIVDVVKKGKELWDTQGTELTDAIKGMIPQKGKKVSVGSIINVVKTGQRVWEESGKDVVTDAVLLLDTPDANVMAEENGIVEEAIYPTEVGMEADDSIEDTFFEDKLNGLMDTVKNTNPTNPQEVMTAISALTQVSNETIQYVAEQETRREEIRAERDVAIARINAISDSIKLYLEKTFDERSSIFVKQFECVDAAIRDGNTEMLAMTLNSINSLAASSPFKNLADVGQVQQVLVSGNNEWDI